MVQYSTAAAPSPLDRTFAALADPHRRQILDRLGDGRVAASDLATPLGMTVTGVLKHVRALERAQLVTTSKEGRTRWCQLAPRSLDEAAGWIEQRRRLWEGRLDRFERHVGDLAGPTAPPDPPPVAGHGDDPAVDGDGDDPKGTP